MDLSSWAFDVERVPDRWSVASPDSKSAFHGRRSETLVHRGEWMAVGGPRFAENFGDLGFEAGRDSLSAADAAKPCNETFGICPGSSDTDLAIATVASGKKDDRSSGPWRRSCGTADRMEAAWERRLEFGERPDRCSVGPLVGAANRRVATVPVGWAGHPRGRVTETAASRMTFDGLAARWRGSDEITTDACASVDEEPARFRAEGKSRVRSRTIGRAPGHRPAGRPSAGQSGDAPCREG